VRSWLKDVVIKNALCPWAARSLRNKALRIVTSTGTDEASVLDDVRRERRRLFRKGAPELSTTLLVCPRVRAWEDFGAFDDFVRRADEAGNNTGPEALSLVAFHPRFARWRTLCPDLRAAVERGSSGSAARVWAHYEEECAEEHVRPGGRRERVVTYRRSAGVEQAVVCSLDEALLGPRKALLRFDDGAEQEVPTEWIAGPAPPGPLTKPDDPSPTSAPRAALLAENWLHTCPAPVVHLLRGAELEDEALRAGIDAVHALQLRNARTARRRAGGDGPPGPGPRQVIVRRR
jgi:hypothetical protein